MNLIDPQPKWTDDGVPICIRSCRYFGQGGCSLTDNPEGAKCRPALIALKTPTGRRVSELESSLDFLTGKFASLDATLEREHDLGVSRHKQVMDHVETKHTEVMKVLRGTRDDLSRDIRVLGAKVDKTSRDSKDGFASQADIDRVQEQRLAKLEELTKRTESAAKSSEAAAQSSQETATAVAGHAASAIETVKSIQSMVPTKNKRVAQYVAFTVFFMTSLGGLIAQLAQAFGKK